MRHADRIQYFIRILPFAAWKDAFIRGHVERCPECGRSLATADEARRAIVRAAEIVNTEGLQQAVALRIAGLKPLHAPDPIPERPASAPALAWRWAAAAAGMFAAVLATAALVVFFRSGVPSGAFEPADVEQFQVSYVKIADEPAQTYIFKPHDSNVVIVWAGKSH